MKSGALVLSLSLALAATSFAQLNGTYTIDGTMATGGGNYQTFANAATDLLTLGVSGPVVFDVADGSYVGFGIATPITGASAVNTVTFAAVNPGLALLTGPLAPNVQTVRLGTTSSAGTGPSHVVLRGLTVTGSGTGAGIMASAGSNITVENCTVQNCNAGIAFVTVNGGRIEGCTVDTCANTPGTPGSTTYSGGISAYLNSDNITVRGNTVRNCTSNGIFIGTSGDATACDAPLVVNNFVSGCPGISTYPGGICIRRCPNAVVVNNSVRMPAGTSFPGIHIMQLSSATIAHMWPLEVSNNISRHEGTGPCIGLNTNAVATPQPPDILDYNLYDFVPGAFMAGVSTSSTPTSGYVYFNTLAAWIGVAAPNLATSEANSLVGAAGYLDADDLHLTCASAGLFNGMSNAYAPDDIDGDVRAAMPCRGADEIGAGGAIVLFTASTVVGPAPLSVTFTDMSCTLSPPISVYGWDFQNDGSVDSALQNPTFVYTVPGTYAVSHSITDALGTTTLVKTAYIVVQPYVLDVQTSGGGVGDLTITGVPSVGAPGAYQGFLFISFATSIPVGTGGFFGIDPDLLTFLTLQQPAAVGGLLRWVTTPGFFPEVPAVFPPGSLTFLAGMTGDFVQVDLAPPFLLANVSNVARATF
jgi:parallel beta-helix repeat protein